MKYWEFTIQSQTASSFLLNMNLKILLIMLKNISALSGFLATWNEEKRFCAFY
jgi:hypothetical protein